MVELSDISGRHYTNLNCAICFFADEQTYHDVIALISTIKGAHIFSRSPVGSGWSSRKGGSRMTCDYWPVIIYTLANDKALDALEEQCRTLANLQLIHLPSHVARKTNRNTGYLLLFNADVNELSWWLR